MVTKLQVGLPPPLKLVRVTVPTGVAPAPVTVTVTSTLPPTAEGSGVSLVMEVTLVPGSTVPLTVAELLLA